MGDRMIITLPWPDEALFPNKSNRDGGKYPRRNAAKEYRAEAKVITLNVINGEGIEPHHLMSASKVSALESEIAIFCQNRNESCKWELSL